MKYNIYYTLQNNTSYHVIDKADKSPLIQCYTH